MGRGLIFTNVLTIFINDGCRNKIRLSLNVTILFVASVVGCLIKGNKSHSTVNPEKKETKQNISFHEIDILLVLFIKFSGVFTTVTFSTNTISNSHLHSTFFCFCFSRSLSLPLLLIPHCVFTCLNFT
jgi:hypothetical protein